MKKAFKRAVSIVLGVSMAVAVLPSVFAASATYNSTTYFDEWDWENLSSRYTRQAERLDRGLVAVKTEDGVFLSWRLNGYEDADAMFNIYRDGELITAEPVYLTNYTDADGTIDSTYSVGLVVGGTETELSETVTVLENQYKEIAMATPPVITTDTNTEYTLNDVEVGDLDGDGKYDFVVKVYPSDALDAGESGYSDHTYLDAYTSEGEHLWRIDMGANIRAGAHEIQPILYDFNGDGCAELAVMTADGTVSLKPNANGTGTYGDFGGTGGSRDYDYDVTSVIGDPREVGKSGGQGRWIATATGGANTNLSGPLYLTIFDGLSGVEIDTVPYDPQTTQAAYEYAVNGYEGEDTTVIDSSGAVWSFEGYGLPEGASEYNTGAANGYSDWSGVSQACRFNACTAYLDGATPSLVTQRGIYSGRVTLAAYTLVTDTDGSERITQEWRADSYDIGDGATSGINSQGYHNISVGDLDGSGKDSIIIGSSAVKYDGTLLWSTQRGHGDAQHLGKYDPTLPGYQFFGTYERSSYGFAFIDAATGKDLVSRKTADADTGRGIIGIWGNVAGSVSDGYYAYLSSAEMSADYAYVNDGSSKTREEVASPMVSDVSERNYRIYWDGDLWDEILDGELAESGGSQKSDTEAVISSYNSETGEYENIFSTDGCATTNGTKKNPGTVADIFGDWREELVMRTDDNTALRIYTTVEPTEYRYYTFMHDALYRTGVARENSGYNQPPHIGFYLADEEGYRDLQPSANVYLTTESDDTKVKFSEQPSYQRYYIEGEIDGTLTAAAQAYPAESDIEYQWYIAKDGETAQTISGATASTLTLPTDLTAGKYEIYCAASSGTETATSYSAEIIVLSERSIEYTVQPERGIKLYEGRIDKTLAVSASVLPAADITYQWYTAASADADGTAIEGETSTSFTVPADLTAGEYYYYCVVSCEGMELKSEVSDVTICELTDSENPITGAYNSAAARYEWTFDTAITAPAVYNYSDDYADIRVGLGSGDEILFDDGTVNSGIYFSNPSIKETDSSGYANVSNTGRYIMITPSVDGTLNITVKFTTSASNKKDRIYYAVFEDTDFDDIDLSTLTKSANDGYIGETTTTTASTSSLELTAGNTYVFFTYQYESYISALTYDCAQIAADEPAATPTDEPISIALTSNHVSTNATAGTLYVAGYDADGILVKVEIIDGYSAELDGYDACAVIRAFLWDGDMKPQCSAAEISAEV
ncbi:MAG: hypothetical protein LUF26_05380 [Firmicutes bacterium]|nr:hypothetical protein [Bacillota bacterium]